MVPPGAPPDLCASRCIPALFAHIVMIVWSCLLSSKARESASLAQAHVDRAAAVACGTLDALLKLMVSVQD